MKKVNEITVRIKCSIEEFINDIKEKGFTLKEEFVYDDIFFIHSDLKIDEMNVREILSKAVLIRDIRCIKPEKIIKEFAYKVKEFDENGNILKQKTIYCNVENIDSANEFIEAIGYKEIMKISEKDYVYEKDGFNLAIKKIENGDLLMEVEENEVFDSIEKIKERLSELDLQICTDDYFIKKAEIELNKVLKRF